MAGIFVPAKLKIRRKAKGNRSMVIKTRIFGEIDIDTNKIINFNDGMIGFDNLKQFMLIHDLENENPKILWLQSLDDTDIAFPVADPLLFKEDYNPVVEDELFNNIGKIEGEEMLVLTTVTVPADITKMSVNLKAPIVINSATMKGCQIIVDNEDYPVKYYVYDILKAGKEE